MLFLAYIYGIGVSLCSIRLVFNLLAVRRLRLASAQIDDELWHQRLAHWATALGVRRRVELLSSDGVAVPTVVGHVRPAIIVPRRLVDELSGTKLNAVLAHELAHVRRVDFAWQFPLLAAQAIYWPQPLVWLAARCVSRLRERACDDYCIHALGGREVYRTTLLDLAAAMIGQHRLSLGMAAIRSSKIARRLAAIDTSPGNAQCQIPRAARWMVGCTCVALAIVAGVLQLSSSANAEQADGNKASTANAQAKPAAGEKGDKSSSEPLIGTVVDSDGRPVAKAKVVPYEFDRPSLDKALVTDDRGQFQVPREWTNWKLGRQLLVRHGDSIGFFDIGNALRTRDAGGRADQDADTANSFQIRLREPTRRISGVVVDESQRPIAGASVAVISLGAQGEHRTEFFSWHDTVGRSPLGQSSTDDKGRFVLNVPPLHYCGLLVTHRAFASQRVYTQQPKGDDLGKIVLSPGGSVAGHVIDAETKQPVADAWIGAQALDPAPNTGGYGASRSDANGHYKISGLRPGLYNLLFSPGDKSSHKTAQAHEAIEIRAGAQAAADFQVITGRRVSGRVVDIQTGEPLVDWPVGYYGAARPQSGAAASMKDTDEQGRFEFFVPPGDSYIYIAKDTQRHAQNNRRFIIEQNTDPSPIILKGAEVKTSGSTTTTGGYTYIPDVMGKAIPSDDYVLLARVHTSDGRPLPGGIYEIWKKGADHWAQQGVVAGNEFRVEGGSAFGKPQKGLEDYYAQNVGATYVLTLEPRGYARPEPIEFRAGKNMPPVTIELKKPKFVSIRGRVVDDQGQPIENANVAVALAAVDGKFQKPWGPEYFTDKDGRFEIKHTYVGNRLTVHISKDGWSGAITEPRTIGSPEPVDLGELRMTEPNGVIQGRVVDMNDDPLAGILVTALPYQIQTRTDADGRYRLERLPLGEATVKAFDGEYETFPRTVDVGTTDLVFKLYPKSPDQRPNLPMIHGKLVTGDGKPVTAPSGYWWIDIAGEPKLWMSALRDADHFDFSNVWPHPRAKGKPQRLVIEVMGYKRPEPIEVATEKDLDLTIKLVPAERVAVSGRVLDQAGRPVAGATVWTTLTIWGKLQSDRWGPTTTTDGEGRFTLDHIKDGDQFTLHIGKPGFAGAAVSAAARAGQPHRFDELRLPPAKATLTGVVVDLKKSPVPGARVYSVYLGKVFEDTTDAAGEFALEGLPDGEIAVSIEAEAFRTSRRIDSNAKNLTIVPDRF
jgi:beta-lactamase regulating signal transducer with metallopeptidase domain/protocatechuate 3,4-dioxygenase beta subunit